MDLARKPAESKLREVMDLPFLGRVTCDTKQVVAGSFEEIVLDYEVGASGMADAGMVKFTFKFYSDMDLQTTDPSASNYVSAEHVVGSKLGGVSDECTATTQDLKLRYSHKEGERPYDKVVIVELVDGFMRPGDHIILRIGDKRGGGPGVRMQTYVEEYFDFLVHVDPIGTSRFARVGGVGFNMVPGKSAKLFVAGPRLVKAGESFKLTVRVEDEWGNACRDLEDASILLTLSDALEDEMRLDLPESGWAVARTPGLMLDGDGELKIQAKLVGSENIESEPVHVTAEEDIEFPRAFFADLHVHSEDTVGTNKTEWNVRYGRDVTALDVLGYTANDFNVTDEDWERTVKVIRNIHEEGRFICFPGIEWCGNSAVGGDHNVVYIGDKANLVRSMEWNMNMVGKEVQPQAWTIDQLYAAYEDDPESYLLIPHVGGRRAMLDWHHPELEKLIEITSSWGHFPWFYQDALRRGLKLGASAAGDEHYGRPGGGHPATFCYGTTGGMTGFIAPELSRDAVGKALRARHTWATTGKRLVGLLRSGEHIQGDEFEADGPIEVKYRILGDEGLDEVSICDANGSLMTRNLHEETGYSNERIRLSWGGARIRDRYRWAEWTGHMEVVGGRISEYSEWALEHPEKYVRRGKSSPGVGPHRLEWRTNTFGDSDGVEMKVRDLAKAQFKVRIHIGAYSDLPELNREEIWEFSGKEVLESGNLRKELGGEGLHLAVQRLSENPPPRDVNGTLSIEPQEKPSAIYVHARQSDDHHVWTSPLFVNWS